MSPDAPTMNSTQAPICMATSAGRRRVRRVSIAVAPRDAQTRLQRYRSIMNELFGRRVHLNTWVKVRAGWSDDDRMLQRLGHEPS